MILKAAHIAHLVYPVAVSSGREQGTRHDEQMVELAANRLNLELVRWIDSATTDTELAILREPGKSYIGIRGTTSLHDLYNDLSAYRHQTTDCIGQTIRVHAGGYHCAVDIAGTVATYLRDYPWDQVWIIGHSLGGMIAQILAVELSTRFGLRNRPMHTCTFGQPRAGCEGFAGALRGIDGQHWRFCHLADPVTWIPGALSALTLWPRYVHAGKRIQLPCSRAGIAAHKMDSYLATVSKYDSRRKAPYQA